MTNFLRDPLGDDDTPFIEWYDATPFLSEYLGGYHLAADLNWGDVGDDSNQSVYAIADGEVGHISSNYGGHGDAIVIFHTLENGERFTSVYGHVDSVVSVGSPASGTVNVEYGDTLGILHDWSADHLHFAIAEGHTLKALTGYTDAVTRANRVTGSDGVEYVDVVVDGETVRFFDPLAFLETYLNPEELAPPEAPTIPSLMVIDSSGGVYRTHVETNETELLADYSITFTDIAIGSKGRVFANSFTDIYELNLENGSSQHLYDLPASANGLATDENGFLYIGYNSRNVITVIDPYTLEIVRSIDLPSGTGSAGDMHIQGDRIYYTTSARTVLTLDLDSGLVLNEASHGLGAAYGLHYSEGQLYVYSGRNLYSLNPATGATANLATIDISGSIYGTATAPTLAVSGSESDDVLVAHFEGMELNGYGGNDHITGSAFVDLLDGGEGNDTLRGNEGDDTISGGSGTDTLNGGDGNDSITGGPETGDLRDVIFGGAGDDNINAAGGNDLVFGQDGNDTIAGGFGADELQGQNGNDVITGSALSDEVFGGAGNDFVNGGFGHDRINGGSGADSFYHLGIADHGSDWVQDYSAAEGDVLLFGNAVATADDFQVNFTNTDGAGSSEVAEAFVIYKPTEQIIWALIDGAGQDEINLKIGSETFDLLV